MLYSFASSSFLFISWKFSRRPWRKKFTESIYHENNNYLLIDRSYEDDKSVALAKANGFYAVIPPKKNRKFSWFYDEQLYKQLNDIKRYFLRLKRFRTVLASYDKLNSIFISTISLAFIFDSLFMWTLPNFSQTSGYWNSFAWKNIISNSENPIPPENRYTIFCSLVEFYGKDFFDRLTEKEKNIIRDFYKNHHEFKLSDPSVIENVGDKNTQSKIVNSDTKITNYDETSLSVVKNQISAKIKEINSVSEAYLKK